MSIIPAMYLRFVLLVWFISGGAFAAPNVVVSIKPIHSIVSNITQGITNPKLLLKSNQSAHHFHLKPSQLSLIENADLVVAIHPNMEEGLNKTLGSLPQQRTIYVANNEHSNSSQNYHLWLDINHMQNFAKRLTEKLIKIDRSNAAAYQNNLVQVNQKLERLKRNINQQLSKVKTAPIAAYSNTFEYFINSNYLQKSIMVTHSHGDRLSIHKILKAKKTMQDKQTKCLLSTTEIPAKRIAVLTEGLDINTASIDIMGYQLDNGATHYFDFMQNIANKVEQCLQ